MPGWSWSTIAGAAVGLSVANWLLRHPNINVYSSKSPEEEMKFGLDTKIILAVLAAAVAFVLVRLLTH